MINFSISLVLHKINFLKKVFVFRNYSMINILIKIAISVAITLTLNSCATIFGGKVGDCQKKEPTPMQVKRKIRPVAFIADLCLFPPSLIVDFATAAIYKPCETLETRKNILPDTIYLNQKFARYKGTKNAIYIGIFGPTAYSVSYDKIYKQVRNRLNSFSISPMYYKSSLFQEESMLLPVEFNYLKGKRNKPSYLELSWGLGPSYYSRNSSGYDPSFSIFGLNALAKIGYRYQSLRTGFFFKASLAYTTPILFYQKNGNGSEGFGSTIPQQGRLIESSFTSISYYYLSIGLGICF